MRGTKKPKIALVWTQFTVHHVDRCSAVAERLKDRAKVLAVEIASTSNDYAAFAPSGAIAGAAKITLFPGESFDRVARWRRFAALFAQLIRCRVIYLGVPYSHLDVLALAWVLRLLGKRVVLMCDSKFDDSPRGAGFEFCKRIGLLCFGSVIVAGARGAAYFQFLGFPQRSILTGYDTISVDRIRADSAKPEAVQTKPFDQRDFMFVGRFVEKKNVAGLIASFASYVASEPGSKRRLVLVGSGPLEQALRDQVSELGLEQKVVFTGFLEGAELARMLADALGLVLVSYNEQWGLVINEAVALGLPVIVSESPGARDSLVRNLISGYVVENGSIAGTARAMQLLSGNEASWQAMREASRQRARLGSAECFCDAVELLTGPAADATKQRAAAYLAECQA